jgi:hypothetical protein
VRVRAHEAALVEGVAGDREHGDDGLASAQCGRGHGAAAGGNGRGGGHDYSNHRADGSAGTRPRQWWSGGCGADS